MTGDLKGVPQAHVDLKHIGQGLQIRETASQPGIENSVYAEFVGVPLVRGARGQGDQRLMVEVYVVGIDVSEFAGFGEVELPR